MLRGEITRHLSGDFAENHARSQREFGHVTAHPELLVRHILIADATFFVKVIVKDRRKLLHLVTLMVVFANILDRGDRFVFVVKRRINNQLSLNHQSLHASNELEG